MCRHRAIFGNTQVVDAVKRDVVLFGARGPGCRVPQRRVRALVYWHIRRRISAICHCARSPHCQICRNEKDDDFGASWASSANGPPSQLQKKAARLLHAPALDVFSFGIMVAMIFNQGQLYPKMRQHEIMAGVIGNRLRPALPKCLSAEVLGFAVRRSRYSCSYLQHLFQVITFVFVVCVS